MIKAAARIKRLERRLSAPNGDVGLCVVDAIGRAPEDIDREVAAILERLGKRQQDDGAPAVIIIDR